MPMDIGPWAPPAGSGERRLSNSSDGSAGSGYSKATSDSTEYLPTRSRASNVVPGKPATNPLQFVKVGPCELYRSAQEQLKKAEAVAKSKENKSEDREDWQSNLDNWKGLRRKRVEHIIERCVEVKKMENEPPSGVRVKRKTFNEMLEERAGRRRLCPLSLYTEEEVTDLSDLGIGTSSTKSSLSEDCDNHSLASDGMDLDKNHSDVENLSNCGSSNRKLGSSSNEYDTCTTTTISSPEPEEYTYESAIEGYKSRIISKTNTNILNLDEKTSPDKSNGDINYITTGVSSKIEAKVNSFQQNKLETDEKNEDTKKNLPKVDINKRRELFEKDTSPESQKQKLVEIGPKKSIKERLSSLEESHNTSKSSNDINKMEVRPLKERLSSLEKINLQDKPKILNDEIVKTKSLKERLSSLQKQTSQEDKIVDKTEVKEVSLSLKDRLSSLEAAKNKEIPKYSSENHESKDDEENQASLENQMQSFCRSLDSLDINEPANQSSFDRVQSMEDLSRNNTSPSDIETEDSGVHTANGSCAVSQADEHADMAELNADINETQISTETESNEENMSSQITEIHVSKSHIDEEESKIEDTDSASNYLQAVSQIDEDISVTEEITEIQLDKDDDDTLKSLDHQDTSVSLNEPVSTSSEGENVVFEGKMFIQLDINGLCGDTNSTASTNTANTKTVLDALESAFEEMDSEEIIDVTGKVKEPPVYENIEIFYENGGVLGDSEFPLDAPSRVLEPPKEKPPPPPVEDDEDLGNGNFKSVNSTRRIKKEIHNKRNSFLGIEGQLDDSYLDAVQLPQPRPDITSFLQEATKIEKRLYKQSLSFDMDSRLQDDDVSSRLNLHGGHNRQNSEPYATVSDEEDTKHRVTFNQHCLEDELQNLTIDKQPAVPESIGKLDHDTIDKLDRKIVEQQDGAFLTNNICGDLVDGLYDEIHSKEVLRFERELLQLEQEELRRQRDNLIFRETQIRKQNTKQPSRQTDTASHRQTDMASLRQTDTASLRQADTPAVKMATNKPIPTQRLNKNVNNYRHSMPNLNGEEIGSYAETVPHHREAVTPRAPAPTIRQQSLGRSEQLMSPGEYVNIERPSAQIERPSGQIERPSAQPRPKPIIDGLIQGGNYHPMSRHTLQALSAAPSPKLITGQEWLHSRKPKMHQQYANYNQHWLVQEAEQRRLEEQRLRMRHQKQQMQHNQQHLSQSNQHLGQNNQHLGLNNQHFGQSNQHLGQNNQHLGQTNQHLSQSNQHLNQSNQQPSLRHSYHDYANVTKMQAFSNGLSSRLSEPPQVPPPVPVPRDETNGGKVLSVSGRRKCSHCGDELGRGAAMIIESLGLCYHVWCFSCSACGVPLGDGRAGADVRVRHARLHCHHCYSHDDGSKLSQV